MSDSILADHIDLFVPSLHDELLTCVVCKKQVLRSEVEKWVYHASRGVVCSHHQGVKEWYADLLKSFDSAKR